MNPVSVVNAHPLKKSLCFKIFALASFLLLFLLIVYNYEIISVPDLRQFYRSSEIVESSNKRLIDTPGCFLPETVLLPNHFSMKKNHKPDCSFEKRLVNIDDTNQVLSLLEEGLGAANNCTIIDIIRHKKKDTFDLGDEVVIQKKLNISHKELFATKCGPHINFDAHFPLRAEIQEKIEYWKNNEEKPISVLFMGFDTTSRSHYHRSLVKTMPLITKMGFVDFKGHHSVAPYTLECFLSFLMGLPTSKVRSSCAASWSAPFDACPLIWKSFDLNKFITMYIEDGSGSFNWDGQGGFRKKPTDYYPHPLFGSVKSLRHKYGDEKHDGCMSTMNAQNFILDYNTRFLKKFKTTPFFSFTWFEDPFHDSTYSLYGFDDQFLKFFEFLNSPESKSLRENTLMILNADHGERNGDFVKTGYEGFIERSLPGLFIRLPERLQENYLDLNLTQNFKVNSERLTSGFDIHHTLLHLLQMQDLKILQMNASDSFRPTLGDRSSLFVPVSDQRTCDSINVLKGNCICNTASQSSAVDNPFFTNQLINFGIKELNSKISSSKYKDVCHMHSKPMLSFMSAYIAEETDTFTDIVLRFRTNQKKAEFEVQLRSFQDKSNLKMKYNKKLRLERIGPFNRLNLYGNSSWCVNFVTDKDKQMKEICNCKSPKMKSRTATRMKSSDYFIIVYFVFLYHYLYYCGHQISSD